MRPSFLVCTKLVCIVYTMCIKQGPISYMRRFFKETLAQWKEHPMRCPLIVRGARQVGKTYIIQLFGKEEFKNVITLNLESDPHFQACFETLDPQTIIAQIELISREKIVPGETLLFLDEIQQSPRALQSLRYFKEKLPELHVVAAGSLLEFAIRDASFSFPVGRVQFAKLYPLSFEEYLEAYGDSALKKALTTYDCSHPPPSAIHHYLLDRLKEYSSIGGMPAAILTFLKTRSLLEVAYIKKGLLDAFEADFGKYAKHFQHRYLKKIFTQSPRLLGEHVKYSRIDPELPNPAREIKRAIELLALAGLIHPIRATSAGGLPLLAGLKETVFKLLFLDIGLVTQSMGVDIQYPGLMSGPLAEQLVGQELLASSDPFLERTLFFWTREKGTAEIDYLLTEENTIYPIEVKAGKSGKLKSLQLFMEEKKAPFGIKIAQEPLSWTGDLLTLPLYLTGQISRLIRSVKLPRSYSAVI